MYMVLQTNLHENKTKVTNLTKEYIGKKTVKKQSSISITNITSHLNDKNKGYISTVHALHKI